MTNKLYDVIIIGGGPAGYTAALYCTRAGFSTLVIEKFSAGGQMTQTSMIDNYPGFEDGVDGFTLGFKMQQGAQRFGAQTIQDVVTKAELKDKIKTVTTASDTYISKTVVIATGADHKHLGLDNEETLIGKGVGYCATCDGMFYRGKNVAVIGGGNSAVADATFLSKICNKVYLIHRRDSLRATKIYHKALEETENVELLLNCVASKILFEDKVNGLIVNNLLTGSDKTIEIDGLFISIGRSPETELFKSQLNTDEYGYIIADESTKTNLPGVFAVGDVRTKALRQIVTAASDGATASFYVEEYLRNLTV